MQDYLEAPPREENNFQGEQVLVIAGGHFIHDIYSAFLAPLLPLIIEKLSLTLTLAGSLTAFLQIPAVLNPLIGHFADKFSMRFFVILAPAVTATIMSSMGLAPNYFTLALLLFITGISVAAYHAPAPAMIARVSGQRVGKGMSWFMAGGELGRTLGPIIAVWAVSLWSFDGLFRVAVLGWGTSLILFLRLRDTPVNMREKGSLQSIVPKIRPLFLPLAIALFFRMFLAVSMTTYLPIYMRFNGASLWMAGASLSILEIAGVAGALMSGSLSDRLGRKSILLWITVISSLLMLAFLYSADWMLIPILLILGFTSLSSGPVLLALVQDHFPDNRAVGNGIYLTMSSLLRSLVMLLVGMAGDAIGLQSAFFWSALISLLAIPGILMLPTENIGELE
ncbi:MAG: MFS transporter [Anaerolineales bacterium]|nr:MFS transporter [Anaerolineales bacterium]